MRALRRTSLGSVQNTRRPQRLCCSQFTAARGRAPAQHRAQRQAGPKKDVELMLAILDHEWNAAMEEAAKEVERHVLALRSANGDSPEWVWNAATSAVALAARVRRLKRVEKKER